MINKRKILALIILLAGVVVSVSIINSDNAENSKTTTFSNSSESNPSFDFNNLRNEDSKLNLPEEEAEGKEDASGNPETINLTEEIANSYTKQLFNDSGDGSLPSEEEALAELQKGLPQHLIYQTFEERDIRVSSDNSEEAQVAYIEAIDKAMWNRFGELKDENTSTALKKFFIDDDPRVLNQLIEIAPKYLDDLLQIEVPEVLKMVHLDILNVWSKKLTIYKAIANYNSDQLRGYLATQEVLGVIQKSQNIQLVLTRRYNELTGN